MNLLESLLYGFLSGLTEIVPVSSQAHQSLLLYLFGGTDDGLLRFFVHTGILLALIGSFYPQMRRLYREMCLAELPRKRRRRAPDPVALVEVSFLKTAGWIVMLAFVLYPPVESINYSLSYAALFLLINGAFLYIPQLMSTGNKDSRTMSRLDSVLIGLTGALGMLPGISAVGALTGMSSLRGGDRQKALVWAFFLLLPILACHLGFDIRLMVVNGVSMLGFGTLAVYLMTGVTAFMGAMAAIRLMRFLSINLGYAAFAFYSWGAALFAFILYLTN